MSAKDYTTYWNLVETLHWICTRDWDPDELAWDINGENRIPLAASNAVFDPRSLPLLLEYGFEADCEAALQPAGGKSPDIEESGLIGPSGALNYLLRQAYSRRIRMTAIECDRYRVKQVALPRAELNDLEFRIAPGHRIAKVGLWSCSRNTLMWRSPQLLRADVIRVWPARTNKRAAISAVILRHLQAIMSSAARLTRAEAQQRCLVEVPNAYPEAFKKAWALLDASYKKARGEHRSREP
jgi:hypothetical protein